MSIDVSIMIEGQSGLSWPRWQRLARAAEDLGFAGLYRSDHLMEAQGELKDSLETWISFGWLAANTTRIAFGPLVSPISFRNPAILAWQASTVDALACGRLRLGLGAGWQEREHTAFGFNLPALDERFGRLREAVEIIRGMTRASEPVSYEGTYYQLKDALLQPRSPRADGPAIVIGGNGPKRTLPIVAEFADEWNCVSLPLADFQERSRRIDELLVQHGRSPDEVKRTMMTRGLVGKDEPDLISKAGADTIGGLRDRGAVVGTPAQMVDQLGRLAEGGVHGVMLQWTNLDDLTGLELIASDVLPQLGV